MRLGHGGKGPERPRHVIIIRIKPGQQVPCGVRKTFIDGVALTTVLLAYPVFQILLIFLDDVETIVRAPTVDHDILDIRILLIEDREYCPFEIRTLVVRRGDDGDARERIHGSVDQRVYKATGSFYFAEWPMVI